MVLFLLYLGGAVTLLLWSIHLIRAAVEQAFKPQLKSSLQRVSRSVILTLGTGATAALALQSATAVAMLTVGFVASGALTAFSGVILILGADVGSSIATLLLVSQPAFVSPLLIFVGVVLTRQERRSAAAQIGKAMIGLGLTLVALQMIRTASAPLVDSVIVGQIMTYLGTDLLSAFVIGAALAWIMHSSVATVLTVAAFASAGLIANETLVALILGANLGGAAIPVYLTLSNTGPERVILWVNLALRGGLAGLAMIVVTLVPNAIVWLGPEAIHSAIMLHVIFNTVTALTSLPFVKMAIACMAPFGHAKAEDDLLTHSNLEGPLPEEPNRALSNANREVLHMAEHVYAMFRSVGEIFENWDETEVDEITRREDLVDRMHFEIKLYIAQTLQMPLDPGQRSRALGLVATADSLEIVGDLISSNLLRISRRMRVEGLRFSDEGKSEIADLHQRVLTNAQLSLDALMNPDPSVARKLAREKKRLRVIERSLQESHLDRLRAGKSVSIETSNLHQTTLHTMKQVNGGFSTIAQRILEQTDEANAKPVRKPVEAPA